MSDNNRELMKKDLAYILQLNTKINYDNITEVKKARNMVLQKNLFKTALGQKYTKRLEEISNGTNFYDTCVLCGKDLDNSSLVCTQCLKKYKFAQSENKNNNSQSENKNDIGQQISEMSKQTASTIKGGLDILSSKINEKAEEKGIDLKNIPKIENLKDIKKEDVVNIANKSRDTAQKGINKSISFWKSLSGKKKIVLVVAVFVILALGSIGDSGGSSYNQNSGKHKTARETAELAIQNDLGSRCYTESKVVYENDTYIIVAVKYSLSENDDSYWLTFVRCYGNGEYWNSKINGKGIDYDNISQETIDELKLRWEMK